MKINVTDCSRCGGDHDNIEAKAFEQPVKCLGGDTLDYWATCPETGDPILLQTTNNVINTKKFGDETWEEQEVNMT